MNRAPLYGTPDAPGATCAQRVARNRSIAARLALQHKNVGRREDARRIVRDARRQYGRA